MSGNTSDLTREASLLLAQMTEDSRRFKREWAALEAESARNRAIHEGQMKWFDDYERRLREPKEQVPASPQAQIDASRPEGKRELAQKFIDDPKLANEYALQNGSEKYRDVMSALPVGKRKLPK